MEKTSKITLSIGYILALILIPAWPILGQPPIDPNPREKKAAEIRQAIAENGDPVADFNAPESTDPRERNVRQTRSRKYDFVSPNLNTTIPTLDKQSLDFSITSWSSRFAWPAFPCQSDFVATGFVTDAKAYISIDKATVYSEFGFRINKTFKNTTKFQSSEKTEITLNRQGGKVRLPSGKIIHRVVDGVYMPKAGREYLMFLELDEKSQTFEIMTGYEFTEGKIKALDGVSFINGKPTDRYRDYLKYDGLSTGEFESLVNESFVENKKCGQTNIF